MSEDQEMNIAPEHQQIANSIAKDRGLGETGKEVLKKGMEGRFPKHVREEVEEKMAKSESPDQSSEEQVVEPEEVKKAA